MDISEILKSNPELAENLTIKASLSDLTSFGKYCFEKGLHEKLTMPIPEEYMTPKQYADTLQISLVTLWAWDKKGITTPLHIGNKKLYRRSDLEKILNHDQ